MASIEPSQCPFCGGEAIGVNRQVIKRFESGEDNVKVWAFCRNCGHRGLSAFGRFSKEEGVEAAYKLWNNT